MRIDAGGRSVGFTTVRRLKWREVGYVAVKNMGRFESYLSVRSVKEIGGGSGSVRFGAELDHR